MKLFILEFIVILTTVILYSNPLLPKDAGPPSGIRVTVFRGLFNPCDLMPELCKGQVLQTAITVRGNYCLYHAKFVLNCLCVIMFQRRQGEK